MKNTKFMTIFGKCNPKLGSKIYGFCHQTPMGYGLWYAFPHPPSRWTAGAMGYKRLWVIWVMGYDRSDCSYFINKIIYVISQKLSFKSESTIKSLQM